MESNEEIKETLTYIENYISNVKASFFIVFGKDVNKDFSNIKAIESLIIPNIGETIIYGNNHYKINNKIISYNEVQDYELNQEGRGGEMIWVFVDPK